MSIISRILRFVKSWIDWADATRLPRCKQCRQVLHLDERAGNLCGVCWDIYVADGEPVGPRPMGMNRGVGR